MLYRKKKTTTTTTKTMVIRCGLKEGESLSRKT